jgi:crotonobetaine/carnitine-CoA ligase
LRRLTDVAAAELRRRGVAPGDRVALHLPNGPAALFTWLALAKLGAITAPLHPRWTGAEVATALSLLEPALVVAGLVAVATDAPVVSLPELESILVLAATSGERPPGPSPAADDAADILLTSGTTGRPKGVVQTHRAYRLTGEAFVHWLGLGPDDRLFTCLPLSHVNARAYTVLGAIAAGAAVVLEERFSAAAFWTQVAAARATQANTIGAMLRILLRAPPSSADRAHALRLVYTAPALDEAAHRAFEERFGARLVSGYGMTECTFGFIQPLDGDCPRDSLGRPRAHPDPAWGNEVRLVDPESGRDVAEGGAGEIWLRNATVCAGYFRDPEATARAITADGWLRTGDLARRDARGCYSFVGRIKEMIRRRGENLSPLEVEAALMAHPGVAEAAVVGVPSSLGEEEVAAFVVLASGATAVAEELAAWCAARLAPFKVPSVWRFPDSLPRTSTERVAKHRLRP